MTDPPRAVSAPAAGRSGRDAVVAEAVGLARARMVAGQFAEAMQIVEGLLALAPDHVDARRIGERSGRLLAYQDRVQRVRATAYLDYPRHVRFETLARCNAACDFCPYPTLERQGTRMDDALLDKILRELQDIPRSVPFLLSPFKVNEPFLDPRLFDVLDRMTRDLPNADITLTSNSTPLTDKKLDRLETYDNIGYLWLSVNDHRPAQYTATMKLPWERTLRRLRAIHARKEAGTLSATVVLSRVGDGSPADAAFQAWVAREFPLFDATVTERGSWIGQVDTETAGVPAVGCMRWFDLSITASGVVAHCCMDGKAEWPLGDVSRQHLLDVYNSPTYRRLRASTLTRRTVSPCNGCAFL